MLTLVMEVVAATPDPASIFNIPRPAPVLLPNPVVANSLVGLLGAAAMAGGTWVIRKILANKRAKKALAAAGRAALGMEDEKTDTNLNDAVMRASITQLIEILQENISHERTQRKADNEDRAHQEDRRWERVEQIVGVCRDLVEQQKEVVRQQEQVVGSIKSVADAVHNSARYFDERHRENTEAHRQIIENQLLFSEYMQDNLPPFMAAWEGLKKPGPPAGSKKQGKAGQA